LEYGNLKDLENILKLCGARESLCVERCNDWSYYRDSRLKLEIPYRNSTGRSDSSIDWQIKGVDAFVKLQTSRTSDCRLEAARDMWDVLLELRKKDPRIKVAEHSWNYQASRPHTIHFPPKYIRFLSETPWIPNSNGKLFKPNECFIEDFAWTRNPELEKSLGFNSKAELRPDGSGREGNSLVSILNKFNFENIDALEAALSNSIFIDEEPPDSRNKIQKSHRAAQKPPHCEMPGNPSNEDKMLFVEMVNSLIGCSWAEKLMSYEYSQRGGISNLGHADFFCRTINEEISDALLILDPNYRNLQCELIAETVCIWGGVPKKKGYSGAHDVMQAAIKAELPTAPIPMDSGWTKVASVTSLQLDFDKQQTIWDSRVALAVVSLLDAVLSRELFHRESFPWANQICLIESQSNSRNGRIADLEERWWVKKPYDTEGHWRGHLIGSWVVRGLVTALNQNLGVHPFPALELSNRIGREFGQKRWDPFTVGIALFMLGK
jgi:hypothetical protein